VKLRLDGLARGVAAESPIGVEGSDRERDHDLPPGERQGLQANERLAQVVLHADRIDERREGGYGAP